MWIDRFTTVMVMGAPSWASSVRKGSYRDVRILVGEAQSWRLNAGPASWAKICFFA